MAVRVGAVRHLLRDELAFAQEKEPLDVALFLRMHSSWLLTNKQCSYHSHLSMYKRVLEWS